LREIYLLDIVMRLVPSHEKSAESLLKGEGENTDGRDYRITR